MPFRGKCCLNIWYSLMAREYLNKERFLNIANRHLIYVILEKILMQHNKPPTRQLFLKGTYSNNQN